jgi:ATPase subunit of ABC transporter with duplicated ATPase domains
VHTENYAEHERQKETYEEQLQAARERLNEVIDEANKLRKHRDVTLETNLRKIRQLETQKQAMQVRTPPASPARSALSAVCGGAVVRVCMRGG